MASDFIQILGLRFYAGELPGLLDLAKEGGLIAVPSAPVLVDLKDDPAHREALENSDFCITDSGFMVLLWTALKGRRLPRISGLKFLRGLLQRPEFRQPGATFWVMPTVKDAEANRAWLTQEGIPVTPDDCYIAPMYPAGRLEDADLLGRVATRRPKFVVLCLGGGVQERLGYFLKSRLSYRPTSICIGAAIAFLSGRQANIPVWADRFFLGWFFRTLREPARFIPRYVKSLRLAPLLWKYGANRVTG